MTWKTVVTEEYERWFLNLNDEEQADVLATVQVLEIKGPELGRPYADTLMGARRVRNLKELRIQYAGRPYRVFYAFDPARQAGFAVWWSKRWPEGQEILQGYDCAGRETFSGIS